MRNIWITLAYEGTAYSGFQRQENSITVQEILETALQKTDRNKNQRSTSSRARMPAFMPTGRNAPFIRNLLFPAIVSYSL